LDRLLLLIAVAAAASVVAALVQRRSPDAPVRTGWSVPDQLDRADFTRPGAPWLVVVFTSASCQACGAVMDTRPLPDRRRAVGGRRRRRRGGACPPPGSGDSGAPLGDPRGGAGARVDTRRMRSRRL